MTLNLSVLLKVAHHKLILANSAAKEILVNKALCHNVS